jgi:transposase
MSSANQRFGTYKKQVVMDHRPVPRARDYAGPDRTWSLEEWLLRYEWAWSHFGHVVFGQELTRQGRRGRPPCSPKIVFAAIACKERTGCSCLELPSPPFPSTATCRRAHDGWKATRLLERALTSLEFAWPTRNEFEHADEASFLRSGRRIHGPAARLGRIPYRMPAVSTKLAQRDLSVANRGLGYCCTRPDNQPRGFSM